MEIQALPAFSDNYIWLITDPASRRCAVVDPGDAAPVLDWLERHPQLSLSDILVTHHHQDHVGGVAELKAHSGARVLGPASERSERMPALDVALANGDRCTVLGLEFETLLVPGHTAGHIALFHAGAQPLLFSGDTLFAGGCGRLFEGTAAQMRGSLQRLAALPDGTRIYCGHEYTLSNLRFARAVEPDNPELRQRFDVVSQLRERQAITLPSEIGLERRTNPFLRVAEAPVRAAITAHEGEEISDPDQLFAALRRWKDQF